MGNWDIEPKYLAGMYVQVQKVYRKHAYVRDSDGTCVWVPLTAFVDPAFYDIHAHPEIPELIKEAMFTSGCTIICGKEFYVSTHTRNPTPGTIWHHTPHSIVRPRNLIILA